MTEPTTPALPDVAELRRLHAEADSDYGWAADMAATGKPDPGLLVIHGGSIIGRIHWLQEERTAVAAYLAAAANAVPSLLDRLGAAEAEAKRLRAEMEEFCRHYEGYRHYAGGRGVVGSEVVPWMDRFQAALAGKGDADE